MNFAESFWVAIDALASNKARSFLTMLGVVIGVAAVILLVSIGEGVRGDVGEQLRGLGSNMIILIPGTEETKGEARPRRRQLSIKPLRIEDAEIIKRYCPAVTHASPSIERNAEAKYGSRSRRVQVVGCGPDYQHVRDTHADVGRFVSRTDVSGGRKVAIIGRTVRDELFKGENPLGKAIRLGGARFRVAGVLEEKGEEFGNDLDNRVFIPVTAAQQLFNARYPDVIFLAADSPQSIPLARLQITRIMKTRHRGQEDFTLLDQTEILKTVNTVLAIMSATVGGIGGISLAVGGIGIMNIMLVSVTERTREIGIRKALGARDLDILSQFLIESTTLSVIGGIVGIAIGWGGALGLHAAWDKLPTQVTVLAVAVAFFFSAGVGVFFGVYPARKASKLDPIEALRYE
ncbi:MAG: ABC transporter permease [Armatimonadota bacterium]